MEVLTGDAPICAHAKNDGDRVFTRSVWTPTDSSDFLVGGTLGVAAADPTFIFQVQPATAAPPFYPQ